jgi:hypothetical protein
VEDGDLVFPPDYDVRPAVSPGDRVPPSPAPAG